MKQEIFPSLSTSGLEHNLLNGAPSNKITHVKHELISLLISVLLANIWQTVVLVSQPLKTQRVEFISRFTYLI